MFSFQNAHHRAWLAACALAIGLTSPAFAKKAQRATAVSFSAADQIPIPKFSAPIGTGPAAAMPQGPARFFTIAGALAKRESGRPLDAPLRLAATSSDQSMSDVIEPVAAAAEKGDGPFGMHAFRAPEGMLWSKWRTLEKELKDEETHLQACKTDPDACRSEASKFWSLVGQLKTLEGKARLERANQLANTAILYTSDLALHGQLDRWTAPLSTLRVGKGDCEDYAILKYKLLIEAGVPASDLKIVLVRDTSVRVDHAVLSARTGNQWFVLDNRRSGFYAERDLPHYMPLFALDRDGVKLFAAPYASLPATITDDAVLPGLDDEPGFGALGDSLPVLL